MRRSFVVVVTTAALMAGAALAQAQPIADDGSGDTLFNFGYDAENHLFLFDISGTDEPYDCTLENGTLTAGYGEAEDGTRPVDSLQDDDGPVEFAPRDPEEVGEDFEPAEEPFVYDGDLDSPCALLAALIAGPLGQVNHGQFVKTLNQLFQGPGRGCVVRHLAQSDLGKGETTLRTPDVDPDFTPGDSGEVDFTTVITTCRHGNGGDDSGAGATSNGNGKGRPDSPGKSGSAPGRNK